MDLELLQDLKDYLSNDYDEEQEPILLFCIKRAKLSFKKKRNYPLKYSDNMIESDMSKYYACIFDLALYLYEKQGVEFQDSHSENGVSLSWKSENEIYALHDVIPISVII